MKMNKGQKRKINQIKPGMEVEATEADLGEQDISKPRVSDIIKDDKGQVEKVIVKKGILFSKEIKIPAERIQGVQSNNKVVITAKEPEVEALGAVGDESLPVDDENDFFDTLEEAIPTDDGLRQKEVRNLRRHLKSQTDQTLNSNSTASNEKTGSDTASPPAKQNWLKALGPGFLSGMSGNDSTAVTAYAVDGATSGYGHLWLLLLSTPLLQALLYACGKIGRITQKGLAQVVREQYGRKVAFPVSIALIMGNLVLIAGDLVAVGSGLELITGINWIWFVVPVAIGLWYITVYQNFDVIKKVFLVLSLAFISYLITGFFAKADWGAVVSNTFIPRLDFSFNNLSSAVAILGATISPYTMFWQVQGEKEEQRSGSTLVQVKTAAIDIASGVISGNLVAYFIILTTSATLFTHHKQIKTAADAATSLQPLVGDFAKYLFAVGLIGAGLIAIPVLLASTSYALSGTFSLPHGLSKKPWQSEGFYLILTVALVASLIIALLGFDPIQLMFWANIIQAFLAPILIVLIFIIGNNRQLMGRHRLGLITNIGLVMIGLIMVIAVALLVFGMVTGQGGS